MEEFYNIFTSEIRVKILEILQKESLSYSDLLTKLDFNTTGKLNFHLKSLQGLLEKNDLGLYRLTEKGKQFLQIYRLNQSIIAGEVPLTSISPTQEKKTGIHRVGIILCTCMASLCQSIGGDHPPIETIRVLIETLSEISGVVSVKVFDHLCQVRSQKEITDWIQSHYINRIVVAACSPHLHEHLFAEIFRDVFPLSKVEFVNLREQVTWVNDPDHKDNGPVKEKIALLIEAAVARAKLQSEIQSQQFTVEKAVAIIGSGIAGINLAKNLAAAGVPKIYLIESTPTLGGKVIRWSEIAGFNDCCACILSEEMVDLATWKSIEILTFTDIKDIRGVVGNYLLDLNVNVRYVDPERCRACQACVQVCKEGGNLREDEFDFNLKKRAVIDFPFAYAFPYLPYINRNDLQRCEKCRKCEEVCKKKAINFSTQPFERTVKVGAIVFAIGADINDSFPELNEKWGENVMTAAQFERMLSVDGPTGGKILTRQGTVPRNVAIIQCAGPMTSCNRFCCLTARKYSEAVKKQLGPEGAVAIFYDLDHVPPTRLDELLLSRPSESLSNFSWNNASTYHRDALPPGGGGSEFLTLYKTYKDKPAGNMIAHGGFPMGLPVSQEEGHLVRKIRIDPVDPHEPKPGCLELWSCNVNGTPTNNYWPAKANASGRTFSKQRVTYLKERPGEEPEEEYYEADLVILNTGLKPTEDIKRFKSILDFNLAGDGYIYPESLPSGVFAVGTVTGPKGYRDVLDEVNETFVKVLRFINVSKSTESQAMVEVNNENCSMCGLCLRVCPYNALKLSKDKKKITLDLLSCKACGLCVVTCPAKALEHPYNSTDKLMASIDVLAKYSRNPKAIAFCCRSCGYAASDEAGRSRLPYHTNVFILPVPCMGRLDANFILHAFEVGFDSVFAIGCHEANCRYISGVTSLKNRIDLLRTAFPTLTDKIIHVECSAVEGSHLANEINRHMEKLQKPQNSQKQQKSPGRLPGIKEGTEAS